VGHAPGCLTTAGAISLLAYDFGTEIISPAEFLNQNASSVSLICFQSCIPPPFGVGPQSLRGFVLCQRMNILARYCLKHNGFDGFCLKNMINLRPMVSWRTMRIDAMRLKELRVERLVSQDQLHKISGVSRDAISRIESGKTQNVQYKTIKRLADALGVPYSELMVRD
jgi:DNA-binding Xre family transcriptional regulator